MTHASEHIDSGVKQFMGHSEWYRRAKWIMKYGAIASDRSIADGYASQTTVDARRQVESHQKPSLFHILWIYDDNSIMELNEIW